MCRIVSQKSARSSALTGIGMKGTVTILKINENATLVFSISFLHGLVNQILFSSNNCTLHILSKDCYFQSIDCQYALFKIACSKTSYLTPCNVAHE